MTLTSRGATPRETASVEDLVLRIRWERLKKAQFEPLSPGWTLVERRERELLDALHRLCGLENVTPHALEWLVSRS